MNIPGTLSNLQRVSGERRLARRARRNLERELADYRTPAERLELEAILERHSVEETSEIRRLLVHQAVTTDIDRRLLGQYPATVS